MRVHSFDLYSDPAGVAKAAKQSMAGHVRAMLEFHKLGVPTTAACFDLNAACSGFVYSLDTACAMLTSGRYRKALVIGVEKLSAVLDWQDRTTCVLFGDGAGATVIGLSDEPNVGLIGTRLGTSGAEANLLYISHGGTRSPATSESIAARDLVPGDILLLAAGEAVGADARLFEARIRAEMEADQGRPH